MAGANAHTRTCAGRKRVGCVSLKKAGIMNGITKNATGINTIIIGAIANRKNGGSSTIITPVIVNLNSFKRR
jgi:hypothetical protein